MNRFIRRALEKLDKLDKASIKNLIHDLAGENERLAMVLDSMTDGVIVTDRTNKILLHNKSAERLIPLIHGDLTDVCLCKAIDDKVISSFINEKLESQDRVFDRDFSLNDSRIIACSLMPLVQSGTIQGSLLHIEDVTEKRTKEVRLRRAESLAALTTLTAGVAHEIKNPLGSISIHIQLMQKILRNRESIKTAEINKHLEVINEEVDRLNMIVVDFLFAVRPMDAKLIMQNFNHIITELAEFVKYELEQKKINLELKLTKIPNLPLDEKYMKQAFLNLIKNAQDALPDGGTITICTQVENSHVSVQVADTGSGIEEAIRDKIFEPYFTTKDFSSGLGLTLVYKIIKEHNGDISLHSKPGEGTCFKIFIPVPQIEKKLLEFGSKVL